MDEKEKLRLKNSFDGSLVYGTRNFNKATGRNEHVDVGVKQATDFFIDPKTGLLKDNMAEYRLCPVCDKDNNEEIFIKDGFRHVKCSCGFIFVNSTAKNEYRDCFFKEVYQTWTKVLLSQEQEKLDIAKFKYGLDIITSYVPEKGPLVDIGAGTGLFLKVARDAEWRVSGVEFNRKAVENIKILGIDVFDRPLDDGVYPENSVDVVSIWEVLEHINHPNEFLNQTERILKPGGILFVCVPNINALVTRILHEKSGTFGGHTHVNFFNVETLSRLLKKHGFEICETDTVITEIGTIKNYLSYEDPYSGSAEPELPFLTPEFIYKYNLGSRIIVVAKKKLS